MKTRQTQTITSKQKSKQVPRIRIASFLELPENRFNDFVVGVENRPLFKKLISPVDDSNKVISYKRFAHTGLYLNTTELYEGATRDRTTEDVESLLVSRPGVAEIVISIGIEKFKKYFLDNEDNVSVADISAACGISPNDVVEVNSLVMDMSLHQEFYGSPTTNYAHESHFHKVAVIEHDGTGDFFIKFCSSRYNSGKYVIDDAKLKILKEKNTFTISELADLNNLLGDIELINERKTSLYQILYQLIHKQKSYMSSGDIRHLCAYTQKELASDIECDTSTASRALDGRSIAEMNCNLKERVENNYGNPSYNISGR
ncbi:MAG: hypothetical protein ABSH12_07445 [Endomicrobiales bacterium]